MSKGECECPSGARVKRSLKSKNNAKRRSFSLFQPGHPTPGRGVQCWALHMRRDADNLECVLKEAARMAKGLERNETCQEQLQVFNQVWLI